MHIATSTTTDVPDELVSQVLEAATYAPSAENTQPWVFVVVRDAARRQAIGELTRQAWERGGREYSRTRLSPTLFREVDRGATGGVSDAPVLVIVGVDTSRCAGPALSASIFPAIENLLLAAHAVGLGAALTTLPAVLGTALHDLVDFPQHVDAVAVVPLGWPTRALGPPRRAPIADKAHRERYGDAW